MFDVTFKTSVGYNSLVGAEATTKHELSKGSRNAGSIGAFTDGKLSHFPTASLRPPSITPRSCIAILGLKMDDSPLTLGATPRKDGSAHYIMLTKDQKSICRTQCLNPPFQMPPFWNISTIVREKTIHFLNELPHCFLRPAPQNSHDQREWRIFLGFLQKHMMVAVAKFQLYELYILPPSEGSNFSHAVVAYRLEKVHKVDDSKTNGISVADETMIQPAQLLFPEASSHTNQTCRYMQPSTTSRNACFNSRPLSPLGESVVPSCFTAKEFADRSDAHKTGRCSANSVDRCPHNKFTQDTGDHNASDFETQTYTRSQLNAVKQDGHSEKNYVQADPSYLKTLGQAHSGWIFGAIAELVDNSRDAKATRLDISIEMIYSKKVGEDIPMLSVKDDGEGMTHQEIVRMVSFGHKQPDTDDPDHIGRFGIGFKTGAMRLGRDAFVLTQTSSSRSIAFLSQSLNEGKDNLEIPIVSYYRHGQFMELDESAQSEAFAKYNLKAIKEFSPFNKYSIGMKAGLFCEKGTGTQIYIWNLDKWGSDYCLEWHNGMRSGSSFYQGDIFIRSRRVKSRPGQISQKVPLDYSLRSYLEVIFLNPRMKIFIQGSLVKSRPLAKSLNNTVIENGIVMGKPVQLTLGRCQLEWEQANCGIFLYWHGRLIEGYKRVGGMIHNADMGRGVIGVIDVTDIMNDGNGHVWVHSNKQGFQDCEPYARLEEWLGSKADEFWDTNFDTLQLKKGNNLYKPDHEWVQCDKCRKWRVLSSGFRANDLPQEWFCYMEPFNGLCETPEQKVARGVITVSAKRSGCDPSQKPVLCDNVQILCSTSSLESISDDDSSQTPKDVAPVLKRLRRGPSRSCKKAKS